MRWKRIVIIGAGLTIGTVAALFLIITHYDFNQLKPEIGRVVKAATGRELTMKGDIGVKIGFTPMLTIDNVSLQNTPWGSRPEMVRIKRLDVQVALMPLVDGRLEVKRLVLVEPDVLIEIDHSGRSNLLFEKPAEDPALARSSERPGQDKALPGFSVEEIEVEKGMVGYLDAQTGTAYTAALDRLTAVAPAPEGNIALRLEGSLNGVSFACSGTLGPLSMLTEPGLTWPFKLTAMAAGITVNAEGSVKDALGAAEYTFNIDAGGPSAADLIRLVKGGSGPELGPFKILTKLVGRGKSLSMESLEVEVGVEQLVAWRFSGSIKDLPAQRGVDVAFKVFGKDLALVAGLAGKPIPIAGPFEVSGRVNDKADKVYQLSDLKVAAGENDLAGSLQVDLSKDKPGLSGRLSSKNLDLRPFITAEKDGKSSLGSSEHKGSGGRVFPTAPLSLAGLDRVNATLEIMAGRVYTPRMAIHDLAANVVLDNGAITLNPLKAGVGGGSLESRLTLRPRGKAVAVETATKINRMDVDLVARELGVAERPGGKLDLDLNLKGEGGTVAEIMARLNGRTLLVMSNGRINNTYLDLLGADVGRSLLRLLNPFGQQASDVELRCLVSGFEIREGMAHSTALVMDTNHMTVVGEGTINLKTEQLDLSFKPTPKEGEGIGGIGKVSIGLGELARPFRLGGTLARPTIVFDVTQAAVSVGKTVGGALLFGPAAIAAYLAGGSPSEGNACVAAVEASKKGVKFPGGKLDQLEDAARRAVDAAGDTLKKMFRK